MAEFEVKVYSATIHPHPNADRIELCGIGDYRAVVGKGQFSDGDHVAFIPPGALVPEAVLRAVGLWDEAKGQGKLDGKEGNRVKEHRFRGVLSEGIIYPATGYPLGTDLTESLGIAKYEPPLPAYSAGDPWNTQGLALYYDIENVKKYPYALQPQEPVVITEKVHGSLCHLGMPLDRRGELTPVITSKGLAKQGLGIQDNERGARNIYLQTYHRYADQLHAIYAEIGEFYLFGEVYGSAVQSLQYGLGPGVREFAAFDLYQGPAGPGKFLDWDDFAALCRRHGVPTVPPLYRGPYLPELLAELTDGDTVVNAGGHHLREGVIVKPQRERAFHPLIRNEATGETFEDPDAVRAIFKSVSEAYLTSKNRTDYA